MKVVDFKNWCYWKVFLGLNVLWMFLKIKISSDSMMVKLKKVVKVSYGVCRFCLVCRVSFFSDGVLVGRL